MLTFGGAYSGHIRAVAAAGLGRVRDDRGDPRRGDLPLNPSLAYAVACGMRLTYLDRAAYRRKHTPEVQAGCGSGGAT